MLVEPDKRADLQTTVQGISQVYSPDDRSLEQLAHALYVVRKATGSGQRAGRAVGGNFARSLDAALQLFFAPGTDYERSSTGIGFKFFRADPNKPLGEVEKDPNFRVGIATKWVSGHENEKMPQIRDRYYSRSRGFDLVAVVGPNLDRWKTLIQEQGNFAHYYLLVERGDERSLERVVQSQRLIQAEGASSFREGDQSLVEFLRSKQSLPAPDHSAKLQS
jgi:hypothetical protein